LKTPGGELKELPACCDIILQPGETVVSHSSGGGGYGPPYERPVEKVRQDVQEGWITRERAKEVYRVVIGEDGNLDKAATSELRRLLGKPSS
jgi:N-methylhydantoinase B